MCGYEMGGMYSMGQYMHSYPYSMYPMFHKLGMYPMGMCGCHMYPPMCMMCMEKCESKKHKKCKKHKKHHCKCHWGYYKHHSSDCKHSSSD